MGLHWKTFGDLRNAIGFVDFEVELARRLALATGRPPEYEWNWQTDDHNVRWKLTYWDPKDNEWYYVEDESEFSATIQALQILGENLGDLSKQIDDNHKRNTEALRKARP